MLGDDAVPLVTSALPSLMVTYHCPPLSPERLNWMVEFMPLAASASKLLGISFTISSAVSAASAGYCGRVRRDLRSAGCRGYGRRVPRCGSRGEGAVRVHRAAKLRGARRGFSLPTGAPPPETYQFLEKVREHYRIPVE